MEEFKIVIKDLLEKLEGETGNKYQLKIEEFGKSKNSNEIDIIAGAFKDRKIKASVSEDMIKEKLNKYEKLSLEMKIKTGSTQKFYKKELEICAELLSDTLSYKKINGIYNSIDELRGKIQELQQTDHWDDIKEVTHEYMGKIKVGKCKKCGKYGTDNYNILPSNSHSLCQNCHSHPSESIWNGVFVPYVSGEIYKGNGEGSQCYSIGKIELL